MSSCDKLSNTAGNEYITGRVALSLSYNGHRYHGWQSQKDGLPTIQKYLEQALSKVANHPVEVVCAGRTDKGVHGAHQVVHFETSAQRSLRSWVFGCNSNLPPDISVSWAGAAEEDFHARFSATARRYNYVIYNHPIRPAVFHNELTWCHDLLDEELMNEAAQSLVGGHDFSSFRAVGCQARSPFRTMEFISVKRYGDVLVLDIKGNAFLHHMVRNIAGVLIEIGQKRQPVSWSAQVLEARDRTKAGVTAVPNGLFLTQVDYPDKFGIPLSSGAPSIIQSMIAMGEGRGTIDPAIWSISRKPE
jgi:tRNA pseudouridine38-40 synthase